MGVYNNGHMDNINEASQSVSQLHSHNNIRINHVDYVRSSISKGMRLALPTLFYCIANLSLHSVLPLCVLAFP